MFKHRGSTLYAEGVSLAHIAEAIGTPAYVYSKAALVESFRSFKEALRDLPHLVCFAVKANSNLAVLQTLSNEGAGMDIVSGGELFRCGQAWVPGERIVFSGVGKSESEISEALQYNGTGIKSFNVESVEELGRLNQIAEELSTTAPVALRFNPDVNAKTHPYIATGLKEDKFGLEKSEILKIIQNAEDYPAISFVGLSVHIGSQIVDLKAFEQAFKKTRALMDEVNSKLMRPLSFVDLGGGTPIRYQKEKFFSPKQYGQLIQKIFGGSGKGSGLVAPVEILIEPGRAICGNAGVLITKVLYRKKRGKKNFVIVDGSMGELIRPALYQSHHEIEPIKKKKGRKTKCDVVGPICESADFLAKDRPLASDLKAGDGLCVFSAGAYGMTMSSQYNSRPRVPEVLVDGKIFRIVRHRENYEDLILGESV